MGDFTFDFDRFRRINRLHVAGALAVVVAAALAIALWSGGADADERTAEPAAQVHADRPRAESGGHEDAQAHAGDGSAAHAETVHLTPEQLESLGVRVEPLPAGNASSTLRRPATVMFDLDRVAKVGPRLPAKVVRVVRDLGDRVRAGETLAVMSSVQLGRAKADFLAARARLGTARAEYERERSLRDERISSEAEFLEARAKYEEARAAFEAAREALRLYGLSGAEIGAIDAGGDAPLSHFRLTSPIDGVVQARDLSPGQSIGPDETPIHVANLDRLWVMIDAYEHDVPLLVEGQAVTLRVRSLPDRTFEGETDWVSYELDPETRTVRVRAVVGNPDGSLRPGMFGTASIRPASEPTYAMVPVDAVQQLEGRDVVFVPGDEAGAFKPAPVELGEEADGRVEIVAGLQPGDEAAVEGAFQLKSALTASGRSAAHSH